MAEKEPGNYWDPSAVLQDPSPSEKALCDRFVTEYLQDYSPWHACIRMGYIKESAMESAKEFMENSYVQRELNRRQRAEPEDPKVDEKEERRIVRKLLMAAARDRGPDSSNASRVTALATLCKLHELENPRSKDKDNFRGGVMRIPAMVKDPAEFERIAAAQQDQLIEASREDRVARPLH